jgi:hypothetical protein
VEEKRHSTVLDDDNNNNDEDAEGVSFIRLQATYFCHVVVSFAQQL